MLKEFLKWSFVVVYVFLAMAVTVKYPGWVWPVIMAIALVGGYAFLGTFKLLPKSVQKGWETYLSRI